MMKDRAEIINVCCDSYLTVAIIADYFTNSIAQIAWGRMYIPARKLPV